MIASILIILAVYLIFKFVDEGVMMFESLKLTIRRMISKRRTHSQDSGMDYQWKGIVIGFFIGIIFMLIIMYYEF